MLKFFTITIFIRIILCTASGQKIYNSVKNIQRESFQAISWNVEQGLSIGSVNCMLKDVNGFLWMGTSSGLNRFDGSHFVNYVSDKNKSGTINNNHILSLVEDSMHNIWIGTFKGLSRYDIKADTFSNFSPPVDSTVLAPYTVPFCITHDEIFCIEMYNRVTAYNLHSFKRRVVVAHFNNDWFASLVRAAYSVLDEQNNCIWMLSKTGLLQVSLTGKQTAYSFPCTRKIKFNGYFPFAQSMCFDSRRNLIWQNTSEGLMQFNLNDKKFYRINEFDKVVNEKPLNQTNYYMPCGNMGVDLKGKIWIGTVPNGTLIYNPDAHTVTQPFITNLKGNMLHDPPLYFSRDGIVWASGEGIYQLNPTTPAIMHYTANSSNLFSLSNNHVATMVSGPENKIWIGTLDGINIFDPSTNSFQVLKEKDLPGFHGKNIMPLAMDSSLQTTWLKAWPNDALYQMDISTKKCKLIKVNDTTANHKFDMGDMEAELARPYKNGFIFFMKGLGIFIVKKDSLIAQSMISFSQEIFRMVIVQDHWLFLKTPNAVNNLTYIEQNGKWLLTSNPFDSIQWTNIFFNKDDNSFWIGTTKEIIHYDKDFHFIRNYADGFPGIDVLFMLADNYGNVWFASSNRTISRLNIKTGEFLNLSEKDGMLKENINWNAANIKDAYGNIYFASENGFYKITPDKFRDNYPSSTVYIQSISINQKAFPLTASANSVQQLFLKHDENNISITAGIIDYYSNGTSQIRYRLEGTGNNWQYGSNQSIINFNELQPGKYKLVMQASNAVNEFNGPEKILLINIRFAWWQTWWFFTIAVLVAAVIFYRFIRWRLHQKFKRRLQQSEKEKQFAELKKKTSQLEMETLRSQMNPHFIFNCLSSINRFILKTETEAASDYLTKFSRLIRMVLNNSKQELIPLDDELEMLRLYLDLERLRFKNAFEYSITCAHEIDADNIFIPPLILQPFAENAIWHGLMHKQGRGHLEIELSLDKEILMCVITDDGVGRTKSSTLKKASTEDKKSMGQQITKERLALFNQGADENNFLLIEDMKDDEGNAAGTSVILKLRYKTAAELTHTTSV